jgi:hypothetical protein
VETTTRVGLAVMCLSLTTGAGGAGLVKIAHAIPSPHEPAPRALTGTVSGILAEGCGYTNRRTTCYRPVVDYTDSLTGQPRQIVSRTGYRTKSPLRRGERVTVYIEKAGAAWLAMEWDERQARRQDEYETKRDFPLMMGWILIGCCAFGLLLGAGLIFWVDRSDSVTPGTRSESDAGGAGR